MPNEDLSIIRQRLRSRGICVVIPTFNNQATIREVVTDVQRYCRDIIVVNDGSTDATGKILQQIEGITIVEYDKNRGKGHALKKGIKKALEEGFAYAITLDADGQHYAKEIPAFLKANCDYPGALIVGSRRLEGVERSKGSCFANKFSNFWFYIQTGQYLPDTQTGYRLYPLRKIHGLNLLTSRYEAELELMVFASWHGVRIESISIDVYYPPWAERVSHFLPLYDFGRISLLNTVLCVLALVYGLPLRLTRRLLVSLRTLYALLFFLFFSLLVVTPATWIYLKIGKKTNKKRERIHQLIYHLSRFVMLYHGIPGVKFSRKVHPDINFDKPKVIICNHQSHLDLMCQLVFSPKIIFLTNEWVWHNPFYGFLIRNAEYLPVTNGIETLIPRLQLLTEKGYSIAVFPEGTRSADCRIGRFHQGAFYIADKLGLDILPMLICGPGKILPKKVYHLHKGLMYIEAGETISRQRLNAMGDIRQQTSTVHRIYLHWYEDVKNKLEQNA